MELQVTHEFKGLEPLVKAIEELATAIRAQKAVVVPVETEEPEPAARAKTESAGRITPTKPSISLDSIRGKFVELARAGKREELKALLAEYGVENVSGLPEAAYDEVYKKLEALS